MANKNFMSTGLLELDKALGGGLIPGRFIEVYGGVGVGKSLLCLEVIRALQAQGKEVLYVDADQSFDPIHASKVGVNLKTLALARIQSGDLDGILDACNEYDVIIIDPIIGLDGPEQIVDFFVRNLETLSNSRACFILTNQLRVNLGRGNCIAPLGTTFHHFISVRILLSKKEVLKNKTGLLGYKLYCDVIKNKLAPMLGGFEMTIPYKTEAI